MISRKIIGHLSKCKWTKIKGGTIARNPVLGFTDVLHMKFSVKNYETRLELVGQVHVTSEIS
ncbi:hypothetical protein CFP56_035883 [Quercus suber]|uniref:Uncharacterized protein n=1 Tax=Quercus suber TaxID=58331 RepID=A0AAW0J9W2_QUESU